MNKLETAQLNKEDFNTSRAKVRMYPSGKWVNPFELTADDIELDDIACHLSHICRWNGGVPCFYSVAEHSIQVAANLPDRMKKWGLLHDAAEAYIGDIIRPIKRRTFFDDSPYPDITGSVKAKIVEGEILGVIAEKFELEWPIPLEVWKADDEQLHIEKKRIEEKTLAGNNSKLALKRFMYAWNHVLKL